MTAVNGPRRLAMVLAVLAAGVVGCSAAAPSAGSSSATSVVSSATSAAAISGGSTSLPSEVAGESSSSGKVVDLCRNLTKADVQRFLADPVGEGEPTVDDGTGLRGYVWRTAGRPPSSLLVTYQRAPDAETTELINDSSGSAIAVSGVGDKANHPPKDASVLAFRHEAGGVTACHVQVQGPGLVLHPGLSAGAIPDDVATTAAQQYGSLCTTLFTAAG